MIKKLMIGVMAAVLFLGLLPNNKTLAATGGLFDGKYLPIYSAPTTTTNRLTDNNLATGANLRHGAEIPVYEFSEPTTIGKIYVNPGADLTNSYISFFQDKARTQLIKQVTLASLGLVAGQWSNITPIENVMSMFPNTGGKNLNVSLTELDFMQPTDPNNYYNLRGGNPVTIYKPLKIGDVLRVEYGVTKTGVNATGLYLSQADGTQLTSLGNGGSTTEPTTLTKNLTQDYNSVRLSNNGDSSQWGKLYKVYINGDLVWSYPDGEISSIKHDEITNLNITATHESASLSWTIPSENTHFVKSEVYRNDVLLGEVLKPDSTYTDNSVAPETAYEYTVKAIYDDSFKTAGIKQTITTEPTPIIKNVEAVQVEAKHDRVNLSWQLPDQTGFNHVNIYRKEIVEEPGLLESMFLGTIVSAATEEEKIFETNGTYFNDLTVAPETSYEYTLTTQTTTGAESEGVIVEATTLEEPAPVVSGENYSIDENGDYVFTWEQPTEGTIKFVVGGKEYSSVDASTGQLIIPKEDMELTGLGDPDVKLVPISKYGTTGETKSISEENSILKLPFSVNDFVSSGFELFAYVGSFLLLALSFLLFPKLRKLIVNSFRNNRKGKEGSEKDQAFRRFRTDEKEPKEKHEGKEHIEKTDKLQRDRQEREKREREARAAEPKIKEPRAPKESKRERRRAEKQMRVSREPRAPRAPRERTRAAREPGGKRRSS